MTQQKDTRVSFSVIPIVPQDFDGAATANIEAKKAIAFWKSQKDAAMFENQATEARLML